SPAAADLERKAALGAVSIDRERAPAHPIGAGPGRLQADPHGGAADLRLARIDARAVRAGHRHGAESRLEALRERQCDFARGGRHRAADQRAGVVEKSVGLSRVCGEQSGKKRNRAEELSHGRLLQKLALRATVWLPPKSGRPIVFGKMSSRQICSCPRKPTPLPLSALTGI